jgi:hypothetical protein
VTPKKTKNNTKPRDDDVNDLKKNHSQKFTYWTSTLAGNQPDSLPEATGDIHLVEAFLLATKYQENAPADTGG